MKNSSTIYSVVSLCLLTAPLAGQSLGSVSERGPAGSTPSIGLPNLGRPATRPSGGHSPAEEFEGREQAELQKRGPSSVSSSESHWMRASGQFAEAYHANVASGRFSISSGVRVDCPVNPPTCERPSEGSRDHEQVELQSRGPSSVSASQGDWLRESEHFAEADQASLDGGRSSRGSDGRIDDPADASHRDLRAAMDGESGLVREGGSSSQRGGSRSSGRPAGSDDGDQQGDDGQYGGMPMGAVQGRGSSELDNSSQSMSSRMLGQLELSGLMSGSAQRPQSTLIDDNLVMTGAESYGTGFAGTIGMPGLSYFGDVSPGSTFNLYAENSSGVDTIGYLLAGYGAVSQPLRTGGTILADTSILIKRVPMAPGTVAIPFTVPSDALLQGSAIYTQVIIKDAGAFGGFALTNGLKLFL